jgi:hypothetical protein
MEENKMWLDLPMVRLSEIRKAKEGCVVIPNVMKMKGDEEIIEIGRSSQDGRTDYASTLHFPSSPASPGSLSAHKSGL